MAYYVLTKADLSEMIEDVGDEFTKSNKDFIIDCLQKEKLIQDEKNDILFEDDDIYDGNQAQLYVFKHHISLKDTLVEILKILFHNPKIALKIYSLTTETPIDLEDLVSTIPSIIVFIKKVFKKLLHKLDENNLCVYKQALVHFGEYVSFSKEDLISWMQEENNCVLKYKDHCQYFESDACNISDENIQKVIDDFLNKRIFIMEDNKYTINF